MTKKHFIRAAEIVRAILDGDWTNDAPTWAVGLPYWPDSIEWRLNRNLNDAALKIAQSRDSSGAPPSLESQGRANRAIQTAEAFIIFFRAFNSRFDEQRFLKACGLGDPK